MQKKLVRYGFYLAFVIILIIGVISTVCWLIDFTLPGIIDAVLFVAMVGLCAVGLWAVLRLYRIMRIIDRR